MARLAERHAGDTSVPADPTLLTEYFTFTDFAHFIEVYLSVVDLIRDAEDVATLTYDIGAGLAAQSVRYAEVTLSPYSSIVRGIPAEAYCEAVEDARRRAARDHGIDMRWCFDIPGPPWMSAADVTLDVALKQRPDGLISFGLGGPEAGVSRGQFASHFAAAHDRDLTAHLREHDIALEVCPTSNLCTRSVPSLLPSHGARRLKRSAPSASAGSSQALSSQDPYVPWAAP